MEGLLFRRGPSYAMCNAGVYSFLDTRLCSYDAVYVRR